jgi:uncharacterized protein YbaR (Trm112 family)
MDFLLEVARCPRTGQKLRTDGDRWVTQDGSLAYRVENGIPVLLAEEGREPAR